MGTKNEKIAKKKRLLSLGRDCTKREKKRCDIEMEDVKEKSGNASMIGAKHWVNKKLRGDR